MNTYLLHLAGVFVCIKDYIVQEERIVTNAGKCYQVKLSGFDRHIQQNPNHPGQCRYRYRYSTVQFSTVQFSTVQCSTVQYSTVQYSKFLKKYNK
jgi:hypothetical protein